MTVTDPSTTTEDPPVEEVTDHPPGGGAEGGVGRATLVEADLLVEEISIDGMCGVY